MTVIGAMICGEYLLLGADSDVRNGDVRLVRTKLDQLPSRPVAWGFAGDEEIGLQFSDWLKGYSWPRAVRWDQFRKDANQQLAGLNGERRRAMRRAGMKPKEGDTTNVLIAAYVGGEPELLKLEASGKATFYARDTFASIGSGEAHAKIVYETLAMLDEVNTLKISDKTQTMRFVMYMGARMAPMCALPVRLLKITQDGVEEVKTD